MPHSRHLTRLTGFGLTAIAASVALLAACGGGGTASTSTPTSTYQSAYAAGPIAGFGSIVINGVHYDETNASVTDDDGVNHVGSDLKLGMVAEVQAKNFGDTNNVKTATAQSITISRLLRGPVDSIVGTDTLVMFGQTVKLTATTVFDDSLNGGLAAIKAGDVVTVYGTLDTTTGVYTATRVEPQPGAAFFGLRASVTAYDSVAKTLSIGTTVIDVSSATLPTGLQAGSLVRIKLQTAQVNGKWVAVSVKSAIQAPHDVEHSEIEGTITDFTSTSAFSVDGLPVDATNATFPDGSTSLAKGVRVEVEGAVVNGVLVATTVKIESERKVQDAGFEVDGLITAVDTVNSTLVVRGVTISYLGFAFSPGTSAADLTLGAKVEIHGALASDGTTMNATQIKFDH